MERGVHTADRGRGRPASGRGLFVRADRALRRAAAGGIDRARGNCRGRYVALGSPHRAYARGARTFPTRAHLRRRVEHRGGRVASCGVGHRRPRRPGRRLHRGTRREREPSRRRGHRVARRARARRDPRGDGPRRGALAVSRAQRAARSADDRGRRVDRERRRRGRSLAGRGRIDRGDGRVHAPRVGGGVRVSVTRRDRDRPRDRGDRHAAAAPVSHAVDRHRHHARGRLRVVCARVSRQRVGNLRERCGRDRLADARVRQIRGPRDRALLGRSLRIRSCSYLSA